MKTQMQQSLDENIPHDVIRTREQAGRSLSYLETWYVIDRLNQVLGQGNWGYQTSKLDKVFEGEVEQRSGKAFTTSYIAQVALFATIEGKTVVYTEVGYGDGTDRNNPGKAHELATKEAVSDALKRAAKNLGRSTGLALYDKTQTYVGKDTVKTNTAVEPKSTRAENTDNKSKGENDSGYTRPPQSSALNSPKPIKELVSTVFKVLEAQKKITKDEFKAVYQGGKGISSLTDDELSVILSKVKTDFPHLKLGV